MATNLFHVQITDWSEVRELPGSWPEEKLRQVMQLADYDEPVEDVDLADMTLMVLQDMGVRPATELVLALVFGRSMSPGVRQNIVDDLQEDDAPWESHSVIWQQAGIFEAVVLLQRAFPTRFSTPRALRVGLNIKPVEPLGQQRLEAEPGTVIVRLVGAALDPNATLNRVYGDEMLLPGFKRADEVLWQIEVDGPADQKVYRVYSSGQWLGGLEDHAPWRARG
ncbi:MAG: hypothetical protein ACFHX7_03765 [Pseudomonadota bacterium]